MATLPVAGYTLAAVRPANLLLDYVGFYSAVLVLTLAAYLTTARVRRVRPGPAWPLALTLLAGMVLALRAVTLLDLARDLAHAPPDMAAWISGLLTAGLVEAVAVPVAGAVVAMSAARALRGLSDTVPVPVPQPPAHRP